MDSPRAAGWQASAVPVYRVDDTRETSRTNVIGVVWPLATSNLLARSMKILPRPIFELLRRGPRAKKYSVSVHYQTQYIKNNTLLIFLAVQ